MRIETTNKETTTTMPSQYMLILLILCSPYTYASNEYNRYLVHLFRKYGNGGSITFEGLEHLMFNLGLGQIEFQPNHSIDEHHPLGIPPNNNHQLMRYIEEKTIGFLSHADDIEMAAQNDVSELEKKPMKETSNPSKHNSDIWWEFKEMHDPQHRHPRSDDQQEKDFEKSKNVCLSPKSLLHLVVDHDDLHKNKLYTAIIDKSANHNFEEEYNNFIKNVKLTPTAFLKICPALVSQLDEQVCRRRDAILHNRSTSEQTWNAWIYASCAIFILSACGLLGVLLVPLVQTTAYKNVLSFLIAVAVGTLSGDALMHLLPHALKHAEHTSNMLIPEKATDSTAHETATVYICSCSFFTAVCMYILEKLLPLIRGTCMKEQATTHTHGHSHSSSVSKPAPAVEICDNNVMLNESQQDQKTGSRPLSPLAFMVIIGDGLHNVTDGLAIGAAFATDPVMGMATVVAVLAHELPHELGDFALLLQTGVSMQRAICLNIASSVLSFVGMAAGLLLTTIHKSITQWIYSATAGSFLYIAFVDLFPAMNAEAGNNIKVLLLQIAGLISGGVIMLVIALNEEDLEILFE